MNRQNLKLLIKGLVYVIAALLAIFGSHAMSSCTVSHGVSSRGHGVVVTQFHDTVFVTHGNDLRINVR